MEFIQQWLFIFITILLPLISAVLRRLTNKQPRFQQPPSPPKVLIIGNLHQLGSLPHRSLHNLSLKFGPLMLLHFGSTPVLVASTADSAKAILKTHDLVLSSRPHSTAAERILYGSKDIAFSPYGEYWRQARRVSTLHLLSHRRVHLARAVREEEVGAMLEKIKGSSPGPVNLSEVVFESTNNVICRVALGKRFNSGDVSGIKELLVESLKLLGSFDVGEYVPWLGFVSRVSGLHGRMEKNARDIDALLEMVIEERIHSRGGRRGGGDGKEEESFVDVLLSVLEEEEEGRGSSSGFSIDRDGMKAIILVIFIFLGVFKRIDIP